MNRSGRENGEGGRGDRVVARSAELKMAFPAPGPRPSRRDSRAVVLGTKTWGPATRTTIIANVPRYPCVRLAGVPAGRESRASSDVYRRTAGEFICGAPSSHVTESRLFFGGGDEVLSIIFFNIENFLFLLKTG